MTESFRSLVMHIAGLAPSQVSAEVAAIEDELTADFRRTWPKAPRDAGPTYARARVRAALQMARPVADDAAEPVTVN